MCPVLLCVCLSGARSHDNLILGDATLFFGHRPYWNKGSNFSTFFLALACLPSYNHPTGCETPFIMALISTFLVTSEGGNFRANRPLVYNLWGMVSLGSSLCNWIAFLLSCFKIHILMTNLLLDV